VSSCGLDSGGCGLVRDEWVLLGGRGYGVCGCGWVGGVSEDEWVWLGGRYHQG